MAKPAIGSSFADHTRLPPQPNGPDEATAAEAALGHASQLVCSSVPTMTLKAAIELGLLDLIVSGDREGSKLSAAELSVAVGARNPHAPAMIDRMLRLLASHSILTFSDDLPAGEGAMPVRRYGPAPVCKYLTTDEEGISMGALCLMTQDRVTMESWYYVKDAVLNGGVPFNKAHDGLTLFEYHQRDPRLSTVFNQGMRSHSIIIMTKVLEIYHGFDDVVVLVDVGGGIGGNLGMIVASNPRIRGINFDLPHVITQAPFVPGVENVGGDMFVSIPSGDCILMKFILHDWSEEDCVKILRNCREALPEKGKVVVMEHVIPTAPEAAQSAKVVFCTDMLMLLESPSGRERTEKEFEDLAFKSGFSKFHAVINISNVWVMEMTK